MTMTTLPLLRTEERQPPPPPADPGPGAEGRRFSQPGTLHGARGPSAKNNQTPVALGFRSNLKCAGTS